MKAIIVGSGGVARELLRRLGEIWDVTLVDTSSERLAGARAARPFHSIVGDGSSRVVLSRAGLESADAVVAATADDDANMEVCRLARVAGVRRVVAAANDPDRLDEYRELGGDAVAADSLAARTIELGLESRRMTSMTFAKGRAEAIEFRIAEDSPVRGRRLRDLKPDRWVVGAVLREDHLVVPHGDTVFETGDLVTVVGAGSGFGDLVRTFTSGECRFPLEFGKRVAVALDGEPDLEGPFREAVCLARNSRASSVVAVHRDPDAVGDDEQAERIRELLARAGGIAEGVEVEVRPVAGRPARALSSVVEHESVGVIVTNARSGARLGAWRPALKALSLTARFGRPVLLSRGTHPYRRILAPARQTPSGRAAARAAVDLARLSGAELWALAAVDPVFVAGNEASEEAANAMGWLEDEAAVHGVRVHGYIQRGNPVRTFQVYAQRVDLVVLGASGRSVAARGGVDALLARRIDRSVLLVPALGRA